MKKLSEFEIGYICCLSNLIHGHGTGTETGELWRDIGFPTPAQLKKSGGSEFDMEALETCVKDHGYLRRGEQ
jgi:hypothetical protein